MAKTDKNERLERFKNALLKWKEAHESEYNTFARAMRSGDASCYMRFYRSIILMMPKFHRRWKHDWDSDNIDNFDDITVLVRESSLPREIVDMCMRNNDSELPYSGQSDSIRDILMRLIGMKPKPKVRLSLPFIMCWLYFGKSFESMVEMLDSQSRSKGADAMDKEKCSIAVKAVIKTSLSGGYRTQQDWDEYFERKKAIDFGNITRWAMDEISKENPAEDTDSIESAPVPASTDTVAKPKNTGRKKSEIRPLLEYLSCNNPDAVIEIIRKFIINNNTGNGLALPYFALTQHLTLTMGHPNDLSWEQRRQQPFFGCVEQGVRMYCHVLKPDAYRRDSLGYVQYLVNAQSDSEQTQQAFEFLVYLVGHEADTLCASMRRSVKWNIGRASRKPLVIRKARSTTHSPWYWSITSLAGRSVLVT